MESKLIKSLAQVGKWLSATKSIDSPSDLMECNNNNNNDEIGSEIGSEIEIFDKLES